MTFGLCGETHAFQDHDWLVQFNIDRRKEQADLVSPEIFEVILDQLEKEWFLLVCGALFRVARPIKHRMSR
jgi:Enhancer of polycomb-like